MGVDIKVYTEQFLGNEDRRWLGARMGTDVMRSITLDISAFDPLHVVNGVIPSGIALGKITASGLYAPYRDANVDGTQVCTGLLFSSTAVGHLDEFGIGVANAGDVAAAMFWGPGIVKTGFLPVAGTFGGIVYGIVDAAAKADLPMIRWE